MRKKFTFLTAALALLAFLAFPMGMWGQSNYSATYTSNCTLTAGTNGSACEVIVNGTTYDGIKVGTSKAGGNMTVTVPSGAKYLHIHVAAWNGVSGLSLNITPNTNLTPTSVALTSNSGIANNTPFTFSGDPSITDYYKVITFNSALASETTFTFTTSTSKRFVIWGVTYEEESTPATVATPTFSLASGETGTTLFSDDIVELECTTENSTIYYTIGDNPEDPDDQSEEYNPNEGIEISETTTIKAIAYVGNDHSSVATKTYTFPTLITMAAAHELESNAYGLVEGVVTFIDGRNVYAQDETGGICLFLNANTVPSGLAIGDKVRAYGQRSAYNGLIELQNIDGGSNAFSIVSSGNELPLAEKTIAEVLSGGADALQSTRVKIVNATIGTINTSGNTPLTQNGSSTNIYKVPTLTDIEEGDQVNVIGVIGYYNAAQIRVASADDVELYVNTTPTITVDETALSFTYIVGGSAEAQTLAITGTNTTEAIVATVAEGDSYFSISDDEVNWSSTLQLPAAGDAIVVRLNPGLTNGTFDGTITLTSAGAQTVTVTLTGIVTNQTYAINLNQTAGGSITADKATAEAGQTVTLTATPDTGYEFGSWTVLDGQAQTVTVTNNQFTMPASAVEVEGSFSQVDYTITVAETTNGTVECEYQTAHYGDEIWVTVTPAEGYRVASFTVTENGGEGSVTDIEEAEGLYSFDMPAFNIIITVMFEEQPEVYGGEGTFNKVTSLDELEDGGYYVLYGVNGNYKGAMNSTCTSGKMGLTSVTVTNDAIIDPAVTIVWKLEAITIDNENYWMLYNEEEGKYCYISSDGTSAFAMSENPTEGYYSVSVYEGDFSFVGQYGGRMISIYQSDFRCYASSNAKTLYLYKLSEASQDPYITVSPDAVTVPGAGGTGTLAINYDNVTISGTNAFAFQYYDEENQPIQQAPAWMNNVTVGTTTNGYAVNYTIAQNDDADREARFKVYVTVNNEAVESNLVTFTQNKYVAPVTYTLATSIESGRHYIITNGTDKAMGAQGSNNRPAVDVTIENNVATVDSDDICEFVINGPDADGYYTIYDANYENTGGYLYAASSGSNYLRTQQFNDANGLWTITFGESKAVIKAQGSNTRNWMLYNTSGMFSCYANTSNSVSDEIYLFMKDNETEYTYVKDIEAYGNGRWYFIASPVSTTPANVAGLLTNQTEAPYSYDLYRFNQAAEAEWQNYVQHSSDFSSIVPGNGYLYANTSNVTLVFTGTPYNGSSMEKGLVYSEDNTNSKMWGWNLVGNPFTVPATVDMNYYKMDEDGTIKAVANSSAIPAYTGIMVKATGAEQSVTFSKQAKVQPSQGVVNLALSQAQVRGNAIMDNAILSFNEGSQLDKFYFGESNANIYIPQNGKDYAIYSAQAQGEMPVNFKANKDGEYTITVSPEGVDLNYLHLIDNMTGMDIDLLQTPSYTFEATTRDYESRFRLVFGAASTSSSTDESFAFFSNGSLIVNNHGEATLQVVDLTGRILSSERINGACSTTIDAAPGVYMLRLINSNDVKTQKIVVK